MAVWSNWQLDQDRFPFKVALAKAAMCLRIPRMIVEKIPPGLYDELLDRVITQPEFGLVVH